MREQLQEIWSSISRNKLRTFLTGFSIAWGIFMLIILLGSGNGFQNGVLSNLGNMAVNSMAVSGGYATMPYKGLQSERVIRLEYSDMDLIKSSFPEEIDMISGVYMGPMDVQMSYGELSNPVTIRGISPGYEIFEGAELLSGRMINDIDIRERRKVVVIDEAANNAVFRGGDPVGKTVVIGNISYTVVGLYKTRNTWASLAYIPITTATNVYNGGKPYIRGFDFTLNGVTTEPELTDLENRIRALFAAKHTFAPEDRNALYIWSTQREFNMFSVVFNGIKMFIWVIGMGTMIAGVVGVSNIMLVTVRERTNEFGIRKALGAKPSSMVKLVLIEAVMITAIFGYVGMIAGIGVMEVVNILLARSAEAAVAAGNEPMLTTFQNPTLNIGVTVSATILLVIAGMIAGYVPARRAARLKTIDAMRFNK